MRIGVISDTHGRLRPETAERLREVDCILHAGDFDDPTVMEELDRLAPVCGAITTGAAGRRNCPG